ncbi:MAG: ferridoxin, partial [Natronococcus sp.]
MNTGAFVCSCAGTCDIDLEAAREGIDDVDVAASSRLLCGDGLAGMEHVIEEHELDQLIVTCPEASAQERINEAATEQGLHPDAVEFVDQRESAGWVHDEPEATAKTARLVNAAKAGIEEEAVHR